MKGFFTILFLMLVVQMAGAQTNVRADKLFERGDYFEALKLYQKELEDTGDNGSEKSDLIKIRVANCLFHLNDVVKAGQAYKKVNANLLGAEDLTYYAISLVHGGEYDKAAEQINMAENLGADALIVNRIKGSCEFAKIVAKEKPIYTANKTNIDFSGFSSGVVYYKGKNIILAAPGTGENAVKDSRGYKVTRLYNAVFTGDGTNGRLLPFADELADKYHIGAVTFTKDFKRIYYTRTILKKDGTSILKLMTAQDVDGKWGNIEELSVNSEDYSCAHPCLYRDSLLFFVSDMPGGLGGKDIYMMPVNGAVCGEMRNLGEQINTVFDELFPFMASDGKLYFASNGHIGLGGLDIFVSRLNADATWSTPQNMGRPINSSMDDFGLVFRDLTCTDGFVSSNRGGTGYNDFLFALRLLPLQKTPERMLAGAEEKTPSSMIREQVQQQFAPQQLPMPVNSQELFTVDYRYAIQIGAFRNPVPRVFWENLKNVKVYLGYDNIYRYTVGEYPEEPLAQMELPQVQKMVPDAFVMNVGKYVAERKIRNDVKGDNISDDELLLRRLKNFEKQKKQNKAVSPRRYLDRPKNEEVREIAQGYTIVLMSADQVFDPEVFAGLTNVDVCAVGQGKYMYCSGFYQDVTTANRQLEVVRNRGFKNAYVYTKNGQGGSIQSAGMKSEKRDMVNLKDLLTF